MKTLARIALVTLMLAIAAPVYSNTGMQAIQIFNCEFNGDAGEDEVMEMAAAWLKAARNTKGGENLNAYIRFPVAEGRDGDGDFRFVITTPTFAEWGAFTDAYEDSDAAKVDDELDKLVDCGESTIWEGIQIK